MGNKIQQGQIQGLKEDLTTLGSRINATGANLKDYINDEIDEVSSNLVATGQSLLSSITSATGALTDVFLGKSGYAGDVTITNTGWNGQLNGSPDDLQGIFDFIDDILGLGGDNLGNHTATQALQMSNYNITGANGISASYYKGSGDGLTLYTGNWTGNLLNATGTLAGLAKAVDVLVAGGVGDNLGDHNATQNLNLNSFSIVGADDITAAGDITGYRVYSTLFFGNGDAITLDTGSLNGNLLGGGNTILSLMNFIDDKDFGDDLGNHTATQNINLNSYSITGAGKVQTTSGSFQYLYSNHLYGDGTGIQIEEGKVRTGLLEGIDLNYNYLKNIVDRIDASGAIRGQSVGDNLGNHKATQNLDINGYSITGADTGVFNYLESTNIGSEDVPVTLIQSIEISTSNIFVNNLRIYDNVTGEGFAMSQNTITGQSGKFTYISGNSIITESCNINDATFETVTSESILATQINTNSIIATSGTFTHFSGDVMIANELTATDYLSANDIFADNSITAPIGSITSLINLDSISFGHGGDVVINGGTGDQIKLSTTGWNGNLAGTQGNLSALAEKIDSLTLGGSASQLKLSVPFNYMNLSKIFTTGNIGWTTEEEDIVYCYSAGGYESSVTGTSVMQSGTAWLDFAIPYGVTGFSPTGCVDITFVSDTGNSSFNKIDITFLTCSGNQTNNSTRFTTGSWVPSSAGVPQVFSLNASNLLDSNLSGHSRAKFKIEWYSISGYSVKMIGGALNFVG